MCIGRLLILVVFGEARLLIGGCGRSECIALDLDPPRRISSSSSQR